MQIAVFNCPLISSDGNEIRSSVFLNRVHFRRVTFDECDFKFSRDLKWKRLCTMINGSFHRYLSVIVFRENVTITHDALGHACPTSPSWYQTWNLPLTSGGHHWRPVQTCSLEDLAPHQWRIQRGRSPMDQHFLHFIPFLGKSGKFVCWRPPPLEGWLTLLRWILDPPLHATYMW